ncbi:hypothetical protein [Eubacterium sp.]|uniref:hypothetical protein n=1 Tax=Eubacterium sp. TaxID=142586 RepID=UPI002FC79DB3
MNTELEFFEIPTILDALDCTLPPKDYYNKAMLEVFMDGTKAAFYRIEQEGTTAMAHEILNPMALALDGLPTTMGSWDWQYSPLSVWCKCWLEFAENLYKYPECRADFEKWLDDEGYEDEEEYFNNFTTDYEGLFFLPPEIEKQEGQYFVFKWTDVSFEGMNDKYKKQIPWLFEDTLPA